MSDWNLLGLSSDPVPASAAAATGNANRSDQLQAALSEVYSDAVRQFTGVGSAWRGEAATAWTNAGLHTSAPLADLAEVLSGVGPAWRTFGARVADLEQQSQHLLTLARTYTEEIRHYTDGSPGNLAVENQNKTAPLKASLRQLKTQAAGVHQQYLAARGTLVRALEQATASGYVAPGRAPSDADWAVLAQIAQDEATGNTNDLSQLLRAMSAEQLQSIFGDLPPAQAAALAHDDPSVVGNLNGVPLSIRAIANHDVIETDLATATAKHDKDKIALLTGLLANNGSVIMYDPAHDHYGVLFGDISAAHVAVMVPGVGDDGNVAGWANDAYNVWINTPNSAVIMWKGYSDPPLLNDKAVTAGVTDRAKAGGVELAAFAKDGLSLGSNQTLTIVAHSYGTVVAGEALKHDGLKPTNVVVAGSPGMDAGGLSDLHLKPGQLYADQAPNDFVANNLGGLGKLPTAPSFGAIRLAANSPTATTQISSHFSYFANGSQSLTGVSDVISGQVTSSDIGPSNAGDDAADQASQVAMGLLDPTAPLTNYIADHVPNPLSDILQVSNHLNQGIANGIGTGVKDVVDLF